MRQWATFRSLQGVPRRISWGEALSVLDYEIGTWHHSWNTYACDSRSYDKLVVLLLAALMILQHNNTVHLSRQ